MDPDSHTALLSEASISEPQPSIDHALPIEIFAAVPRIEVIDDAGQILLIASQVDLESSIKVWLLNAITKSVWRSDLVYYSLWN